jgi:hypothetical protein
MGKFFEKSSRRFARKKSSYLTFAGECIVGSDLSTTDFGTEAWKKPRFGFVD